MRLFKKIVRKLYHLIWFLSLFILFVIPVYATDGQINGSIFSSDISSSGSAEWFDVDHNSITTNLIQQATYSPYFRASGRYNSYLSFSLTTNLEPDFLYSLTIYVNNNTNSNLVGWNNAVATGTYNGGANSNNSNATCRAYIYSFTGTYNIKYKISINQDGTSEAQTGAYYITFVPSCSGTFINIPIAFSGSSTYMYYYGYHLEPLGMTNDLTASDVQSIINNSGLATASSVGDVQRSVNDVKQQLSGVQDSIDDVNDTLNDSSVDSSSNTLNSISNSLPTNSVISDLILLPVTMLQSIVNSLGSTCSSFSLGSLYGTNLVMPCIDLSSYLGSTIWTFIDLVFSGMFVLVIRKRFVKIFNNITNLKGGDNEVD